MARIRIEAHIGDVSDVYTEWLVWSFEHNAWWGPGEMGYVAQQSQAGRYPMKRAIEIARNANIGEVKEAVVPIPKR
jgi:hypothetical protein